MDGHPEEVRKCPTRSRRAPRIPAFEPHEGRVRYPGEPSAAAQRQATLLPEDAKVGHGAYKPRSADGALVPTARSFPWDSASFTASFMAGPEAATFSAAASWLLVIG